MAQEGQNPKAAGEEPSRPRTRARAGSRGRSQHFVVAPVIKDKAHIPLRKGEEGGRDGRGKPACKEATRPPGLLAASAACRWVKVSTPALCVCTHGPSSVKRNRVPGTPTPSPLTPVLTTNLQAGPVRGGQLPPSLAREPRPAREGGPRGPGSAWHERGASLSAGPRQRLLAALSPLMETPSGTAGTGGTGSEAVRSAKTREAKPRLEPLLRGLPTLFTGGQDPQKRSVPPHLSRAFSATVPSALSGARDASRFSTTKEQRAVFSASGAAR